MQDYTKMEINELANQLKLVDDENFKIIVKQIDTEKLKSLQVSLSDMDKLLRISQELSFRKNNIKLDSIIVLQNKKKLEIQITEKSIIPTPNLILRSSLFSASKTHGCSKEAVRDFEIETYGKNSDKSQKIFLTAFRQLTQLDLDLLLELIKLQQEQQTLIIKVSAYNLIKKVKGYGEGKQSYLQIKEQIEILAAAKLKISVGRFEFFGSILNNAYFDNDEELYIIKFNEDIQPLFAKSNWTGIDINIRKQLKTNLAKWLHGFYSSHVNSNIPIKLKTIYELSGATDKDKAQWIRISLYKALEHLQVIFNKNGKSFKYLIKDESLFVKKTQSLTQNKSVKNKIIVKNSQKSIDQQTSII